MDQFASQEDAYGVRQMTAAKTAPAVTLLWWRALRLRCTACGRGPIFRGRFAMYDECAHCGRRFNRGPGYLLGSIYFNYGVTATLVLIGYFAMFFGEVLEGWQRLVLLSVFASVFAMWFFRYARALWMAFDERWDPWPNEEEVRALDRGETHVSDNERV